MFYSVKRILARSKKSRISLDDSQNTAVKPGIVLNESKSDLQIVTNKSGKIFRCLRCTGRSQKYT